MSVLKMSGATTLRFLGMYERETCLWDPGEPAYRNRDERVAAAQRIADELDLAGFGKKQVMHKFKNLRSSYCQELKKMRESARAGCSVDDAYTPSVAWFPVMDAFIRPHTKPTSDRNEYGMENEEQSSPYESTAAPEELNPMQLIPNEMIKMETPTEDAPFCSYPSAERDAEDEDYYISKAWSAKLKRLAPDQKMYAEKAINDIMFEAGLGTLHKYSVQINEILPVNISHLSSVLKHGTVTEANMDNTF